MLRMSLLCFRLPVANNWVLTCLVLALSFWATSSTHARCNGCGMWALNRDDGSYAFMEIRSHDLDLLLEANLYVSSGGQSPNQWEENLVLRPHGSDYAFQDQTTECYLIFSYQRNAWRIRSKNPKTFRCGFSAGVSPDGVYKRVAR